jgi:CHAT domain-containing protein/tetratricopeptide (TPR) repeat protein
MLPPVGSASATGRSCPGASESPAVIKHPPVSIVVNEPLTVRLGVADQLEFEFNTSGGQSLLVEVFQNGLDIIATIQSPDGIRQSYNSPLRRDEREFVLLEDMASGKYVLTLNSDEHTNATATSTITISTVSPGSSDHSVAIWRSFTSAALSMNRVGKTHWTLARSSYEAAAELARDADDEMLWAYALYATAMLDYWHLDQKDRAVESAARASAIYGSLDRPGLSANARALRAAALVDIAAASDDPSATFQEALVLFDQAAASQQRAGRTYDFAHTLNNIGLTHYYLGNWDTASDYWRRALPIFTELGDSASAMLPMGNLGSIDAEQGHLTAAAEAFESVLRLQAEGKDLQWRVDYLSNLAVVERILDNFDNALLYFSCAKQISEDIDYLWGLGWALAGIGETYYSIGEFDLANRYLRDALVKEREAGDTRGTAAVLRHLGNLEYRKGNFNAALDFHREAVSSAISPQDQSLANFDVARTLSALERHDEAIALLDETFVIAKQARSDYLIADAHQALGRAYLGVGRADQASTFFRTALDTYRSLGVEVEQARTLNGLALAAMQSGQLESAADYGEASLEVIERIRGRVSDPELRAFYLSARREYLELQIDMFMRLHGERTESDDRYLHAALGTSERSRARLTLDLLQQGRIQLDPRNSRAQRRRAELRDQLAEKRYLRDRLVQKKTSGQTDARYTALLSELAELETQLYLLDTEIQRSDSLALSRPLDAKEMQVALGSDVVLLQYALGIDNSYVWVVTSQTIHWKKLPGEAEIDELARMVVQDMRSPTQVSGGPVDAKRRREQLSDLIIAPVAEFLGHGTVLIAADGALQYVPFATLSARLPDGSRQMLVESHEVVSVPSVSAIVHQRESSSKSAPTKDIAVFADPVFEANDVRFAGSTRPRATPAAGLEPLTLASGTAPAIHFDRLPMTAIEAETVLTLVPEDKRYVALGFDASRDAILAAGLADYRIVHLATHGVIDSRYPDLSALVFSRFDEQGTPRNGFLRLPDILTLELNAELVVLSACETALGREIRAEGLLGFTQGFMQAGARSLVVSLWPVSDRATAELMRVFYDNFLNAGMRPARALRLAQQSLAEQRRWRNPYFWAAFTLIGEWS